MRAKILFLSFALAALAASPAAAQKKGGTLRLGAAEDFEPFGVGYVELPGQVKVETRLTESDPEKLRIGMDMELTLVPLSTDAQGNTVMTFAFRPAAG
jgi:uncharacterized OB-fold protein